MTELRKRTIGAVRLAPATGYTRAEIAAEIVNLLADWLRSDQSIEEVGGRLANSFGMVRLWKAEEMAAEALASLADALSPQTGGGA